MKAPRRLRVGHLRARVSIASRQSYWARPLGRDHHGLHPSKLSFAGQPSGLIGQRDIAGVSDLHNRSIKRNEHSILLRQRSSAARPRQSTNSPVLSRIVHDLRVGLFGRARYCSGIKRNRKMVWFCGCRAAKRAETYHPPEHCRLITET